MHGPSADMPDPDESALLHWGDSVEPTPPTPRFPFRFSKTAADQCRGGTIIRRLQLSAPGRTVRDTTTPREILRRPALNEASRENPISSSMGFDAHDFCRPLDWLKMETKPGVARHSC